MANTNKRRKMKTFEFEVPCSYHYTIKANTEEEAREIWQGSWRGKSGTDPFVNRGGYRCRHSFILYDDDWFTEETNDNIKEQEKIKKRIDYSKMNLGYLKKLKAQGKIKDIYPPYI